MDLVNSAIQFKQAATMANVQYTVAAKLLNSQRQQGAAVVNMINAADLGVNRAANSVAASATGTGMSIDTYG